MLKTKILYQLGPNNSGEVLENINSETVKINRNGLVFFIQVNSSKPLDILSEKQNSNF